MCRDTAVVVAPLPDGVGTLILHRDGSGFHGFIDRPDKPLVELSAIFIREKRHWLAAIFSLAQRKLEQIGLDVVVYEL